MMWTHNGNRFGSAAVDPEVVAVVVSEVVMSAPVAMPREQVSLVFNPGSGIMASHNSSPTARLQPVRVASRRNQVVKIIREFGRNC